MKILNHRVKAARTYAEGVRRTQQAQNRDWQTAQ